MFRAISLSLTLLALGCQPDLGVCDPTSARRVAYEEIGLPAYEGQALLVRSCGYGSFCHSARVDPEQRYGAPAGLAFDVQLVAADGVVDESDILAQRRARFRVVQEASAILGSVDLGTMPPAAAAGSDVESVLRGAPVFRRPDGGELPPVGSDEGREILRNWLACGAPVVERGAAREDGVAAVVEQPLFMPDVEPNWPSIFADLVGSPRCASRLCHGGNDDAGFEALDRSSTYAALVDGAASGDDCGSEHRLVVAGDPAASLLWTKLTGAAPCGDPMPLNQIPVRQATLDAVEAWIACGAPAGAEGCAAP